MQRIFSFRVQLMFVLFVMVMLLLLRYFVVFFLRSRLYIFGFLSKIIRLNANVQFTQMQALRTIEFVRCSTLISVSDLDVCYLSRQQSSKQCELSFVRSNRNAHVCMVLDFLSNNWAHSWFNCAHMHVDRV